jgi:transcription elongation factor GreA
MADKVVLVTKEGLQKLEEELKNLKTVKRKEVASRIKEAISYGDLSENSEYEEAKNEQAFVEGRILELEEKLKNTEIISKSTKKNSDQTVQLGSKVTVQNKSVKGSKPQGYTIVGSTEANFDSKISNESPVGNALLDKKVGDQVKVAVPTGVVEYEILKIG